MPLCLFDQTDIQSMTQRYYRRVTFPLDRRRGHVCGGARLAGPGEAGWPGFHPILPSSDTLAPEIKTYPKLVELVRIK